jgi:hypothetical protein
MRFPPPSPQPTLDDKRGGYVEIFDDMARGTVHTGINHIRVNERMMVIVFEKKK